MIRLVFVESEKISALSVADDFGVTGAWGYGADDRVVFVFRKGVSAVRAVGKTLGEVFAAACGICVSGGCVTAGAVEGNSLTTAGASVSAGAVVAGIVTKSVEGTVAGSVAEGKVVGCVCGGSWATMVSPGAVDRPVRKPSVKATKTQVTRIMMLACLFFKGMNLP